MKLIIFHYHLQPGGVTGVITHMVKGINKFSDIVERTCVVAGSIPETTELPESAGPETMPTIGYITRERLAEYAVPPTEGADGGDPTSPESAPTPPAAPGPIPRATDTQVAAGTATLARRIAGELIQRFGGKDTVWWVHNYHIGKNPAFTKAILDIAAAHPQQAIVLHIHDFPESGRYTNLRFLEKAGITNLYPQLPNITYVTINTRDRDILTRAGIHSATYLPNPIDGGDAAPASTRTPTTTRRRLAHTFGVEFARFNPEDRLFLYPVRSIRRKNIFEAALITMLQDTPTSLIVSLPGTSHQEKKYSSMAEHAFLDGTIPGMFGIGTNLDRADITFQDLQHAADAIISSSVQEGFGYQYMAPLQLGLPLIARQLDTMTDVQPLFDNHPHTWYTSIRVPGSSPSLSGPYSLLRFRYEERIDRLASFLPKDALENLYRELDTVLSTETMEFSYILPHMQYVMLQDIRRDPAFRRDVQTLNADLLKSISDTLTHAPAAQRPAPVQHGSAAQHDTAAKDGPAGQQSVTAQERFGLAHVTALTEQILTNIAGATATAEATAAKSATPAAASVLRQFARLEFQRLLYE